MSDYLPGDIIRTATGTRDRIVLSVCDDCAYHRDKTCLGTRSLRDGKPFGPYTHNAADSVTLVRKITS